MLTHLHHLTFLVRDLDASVKRYEDSFAAGAFLRESLPARGVNTARLKLGDTWLVLAEPVDPDGAPGRHLNAHGEGLFRMSFGVADLDQSIKALAGKPISARPESRRKGLADWQVVDLDSGDSGGPVLQLTAK